MQTITCSHDKAKDKNRLARFGKKPQNKSVWNPVINIFKNKKTPDISKKKTTDIGKKDLEKSFKKFNDFLDRNAKKQLHPWHRPLYLEVEGRPSASKKLNKSALNTLIPQKQPKALFLLLYIAKNINL